VARGANRVMGWGNSVVGVPTWRVLAIGLVVAALALVLANVFWV